MAVTCVCSSRLTGQDQGYSLKADSGRSIGKMSLTVLREEEENLNPVHGAGPVARVLSVTIGAKALIGMIFNAAVKTGVAALTGAAAGGES